MINPATVTKIRALRRMAELVDEGQARGEIETAGGDQYGNNNVPRPDKGFPATLPDLGNTRQRLGFDPKTRHSGQTPLVIPPARDFLKNPSYRQRCRLAAANDRELKLGVGSKPKHKTLVVCEEPGLSKGASGCVFVSLHDGFGEPFAHFFFGGQVAHFRLPPHLALDDLDLFDILGVHKIKDMGLDLFGFVGMAFSEKDAVQARAPDVGEAKITKLAARFGDLDLQRPGHFLCLPRGGFRRSITALNAARSKHIVIPFPALKRRQPWISATNALAIRKVQVDELHPGPGQPPAQVQTSAERS